MSSSSDRGSAHSAGPDSSQLPPANWWEAVVELVASRVALIQLESKDAAKDGARRAVMLLLAVGCAFFGWILLLAGGVAWIAAVAGCAWYWVALGMAAFHLILAILLTRLAKPSGAPAFPHTRAEFKKDHEWIKNLQKTRKSNG